MEATITWLFVLWFSLLPGALFIWSYGMIAGRWTMRKEGGRYLLMSIGYSAIFHFLFAPFTYNLWSTYWDKISQGERVSLWLWAALMPYLILPVGVGLLSGKATLIAGRNSNRWYSWTRFLAGRTQNPQAWDFLFGRDALTGWVRLRTKEDIFIGGYYGPGSYVAGYPEQQDIYLSNLAEVRSDTGDFVVDHDNKPKLLNSGLLIRWDEVVYLEFKESEDRKL